jgi:hypothetical protein
MCNYLARVVAWSRSDHRGMPAGPKLKARLGSPQWQFDLRFLTGIDQRSATPAFEFRPPKWLSNAATISRL